MTSLPLTLVCIAFAAVALGGCSKGAPTITFPVTQCADVRTGQTRHQHRAAWTQWVNVVEPSNDAFAYVHPHHVYSRPHVRRPIFHPARDWDEELVKTVCEKQDWRTTNKVER